MASNKDVRLIVRCSKMYYEENMKQEDIGQKLGISKATVSRLLIQAKELGIVKITVESPFSKECIELEKMIEDKFGLQEVIIVDVLSEDKQETKREISKEAAKYLQRILKQDTLVGVSSGTTLASIPNYIQNNRANQFTFVPMIGGNGQSRAEIQSNNIAVKFAKAFKADYKILHAPAMVEKLENKFAFIEDPGIKSILSLTTHLDVALVGIGSSTSTSTVNMVVEFIKPNELIEMKEKGAVADVCNIFIDKNGNSNSFDVNKRVIGIDIEDLRNTPLTIAIAGNIEKAPAIWGVVNAKLVDVLITDKRTAQEMLSYEVK